MLPVPCKFKLLQWWERMKEIPLYTLDSGVSFTTAIMELGMERIIWGLPSEQ